MVQLSTISPDEAGLMSPGSSCLSKGLVHQISPTTTEENPGLMQTADTPISTELEEERGAALLLSVAAIVNMEIDKDGVNWEDDLENFPKLPDFESERTCLPSATLSACCTESPVPANLFSIWNRIRSVSIDIPEDLATYRGEKKTASEDVVAPSDSPVSRRFPLRKAALLRKQRTTKAESPRTNKRIQLNSKSASPSSSLKTILRKKFSWKNFPELEAFLIANREEYLRHSALNYTVQQKQYNNSLTERLLELAVEHGYVFDEEAFSFVTVRDRIRCYFKSYVQSAKKRGVIIGYAAKKAGLLSEDDLEDSLQQPSRIVMPKA